VTSTPVDRVTGAVVTGAVALLGLSLVWLLVSVLVCVRDCTVGTPRAPGLPGRWLRPRLVRVVVAAAFGVSATGPGLAHAESVDRTVDAPPLPAALDGLAVPDRAPPAVQGPAAPRHVRVAAGDCLWTIAERLLGPGATPEAIDRAWRRLHVENRVVVGDEPDLVSPGTRLRVPVPLDPTNRKDRP
jgi:hypothetical protein